MASKDILQESLTISGLRVNAKYYLYHYDDEGNVSLVGEYLADAEGNTTVKIEKFSGNVLTTAKIELDGGLKAPQSGLMAKETSAKVAVGSAAAAVVLATVAFVVNKFVGRHKFTNRRK
ncbi:MAG: hypothetical protein LBM12_02380 [Candidatus Nomurabacteria bacterium]|jgi:hypothetical protein|nr:hypothetical protein [Candidatus Nomurabacteria bacterium]